MYAVASVACAFAPSLEWLLVGRVAQGLAAGGSTIVSRTVIRDLFDGPKAQRMMSQVAVIFGVAPAIAPIVGGLLIQVGPWQTVFWFMAALALLLALVSVVLLPESHPPENRVPLRVGEIFRGLAEVMRVPAFHRMTWAATLVFGAQFLYIGGASIFVVDLLGEGELDFWKLFVPMIGAMVVGSVMSGRFGRTVTSSQLITLGYAVSTAGAAIGVVVALTPAGEVLPWAVVGHLLRGVRQRAGLPQHPDADARPRPRAPRRGDVGVDLRDARLQRGQRGRRRAVRRSLRARLRPRGRRERRPRLGLLAVAPGGRTPRPRDHLSGGPATFQGGRL